jgi:hypothetical protein
MQDLRLIGVQDDGQHLLLADADGARYRVPLDEPLRAAARRDRSFLGQLPIEIDGGLRPREIQALIRRGLSAEEVADRAGWSVEKVRRFEGPILAEREYIAGLARACSLGSGTTGQTLGARVDERLTARGVDLERVSWDSSREDEGLWKVVVHFPAGGRERDAWWRFDARAHFVTPGNDEARWLGEDDSVSLIPTPHVATTANPSSAVFDLEAVEGGRRPRREARESELVDNIREHSPRSRRGRKRAAPAPAQLPSPEAPLDALPLEPLARDLDSMPPPPAARDIHPVEAHLDAPETDTGNDEPGSQPGAGPDANSEPPAEGGTPPEDSAEVTSAPGHASSADVEAGQDGPENDETGPAGTEADVEQPEQHKPEQPEPEAHTDQEPVHTDHPEHAEQPQQTQPAPPSRKRSGRPSVPRWDDIMFGKGGSPS